MADTPSTSRRSQRRNVDGGWAYLILISAHVFYFMYGGIGKSFGVMLPTLTAQFDTQTWLLGLIISLRMTIKDVSAFPAVLLSKKLPIRWIVVASSVIISCGMIFTSFAQTITQFGVFTCLFSGVGFGLGFPLIETTLACYFHKRYACANGLATAGISLGTIAMAPLTQLLLDVYGWRGTFLVIGGILLNLIASSSLTTPLVSRKMSGDESSTFPASERRLSEDNFGIADQCGRKSERQRSLARSLVSRPASAVSSAARTFARVSDILLFKNFSFIVVVIICCVMRFAYTAWVIFFVPHAIDMGFGKYEASFFVTMCGVGNIVGKILFGPLVDRKVVSRRMMLFLTTTVSTFAFALDHLMTTVPAMIAGQLVLGVSTGNSNCLDVIIIRRIVGIHRFASSVGWISVIAGLVRCMGGFMPGWIYDHTNSYNNVFVLIACVTATCPAVLIIEAIVCKFFRKKVPADATWECVLGEAT